MTRMPATFEVREPVAERPASSGELTVAVKRHLQFDAADGPAFESLLAGRPHVGVFASTAWLSGLFTEPPDGTEPALMLLRDGGTLRGVVPIGLRRTRAHVRIAVLGGGAGSDRVDLVAARGWETACADAFMTWATDAFGPGGYSFEFRDVPADSPLWGALHRANAGRDARLVFQPRDVHTLPYLDLADLRGFTLKSLAKHRRWLERRGRLRVELVQDASEALSAFDALSSFLHARWQGQPGGSTLDHPRTDRFHRHVLPLLLREKRLRMIRFSCDMRTVAVFYGLAIGRWWGYYLAGYDRAWAGRIHLGQITLATAIEMAAREGAIEFDFLKGVEPVKYLWPVRERASIDADAYSSGGTAQFVRASHAARETAAAFVKSVRALWPGAIAK